jgi:4-diphosphocytidyl-2-C-methyl-D-erythritol kinase
MNAATIFNFLIKKNFIKINQKKILQISKLIGSDVILGINPKSAILSSNGIIKKFSKTSKFNILLIRPNFGCSTKKIYSGVKNFSKPILNNPRKNMMNLKSLLKYKNDLEKIAFTKYPKLKILKSFLENLNQPLFVRMTGSGSVIVAYYQKKQDCKLAKVRFKRKFKNYWCNTSKTI